jgi:hypothetical protein
MGKAPKTRGSAPVAAAPAIAAPTVGGRAPRGGQMNYELPTRVATPQGRAGRLASLPADSERMQGFSARRAAPAVAAAPLPTQVNTGKSRPADKATAKPANTRPNTPAANTVFTDAPAAIARQPNAPVQRALQTEGASAPTAVRLTPTRGYDSAIAKRTAAAMPAQTDPSAELYARAQELLSQGANEGSGNFRDRMKAAVARGQARRLLDAAKGFRAEQGADARAQLEQQGALQRTAILEEGLTNRAAASNESDLLRTQLTGQNALANTELANQGALFNKQQEFLMQESAPSKLSDAAYKRALTQKATTEAGLAQQKLLLGEVLNNNAPNSAEYAQALSQLTAIQGRADPATTARNATLIELVRNPVTPSQQKEMAIRLLTGDFAPEGEPVQGLAEGGQVGIDRTQPTPMMAGQGAMGMPDIRPQMNVVNDYRAYASAAVRLGATPVSFDQFSQMKMAAAQPVSGFADGGMVEEGAPAMGRVMPSLGLAVPFGSPAGRYQPPDLTQTAPALSSAMQSTPTSGIFRRGNSYGDAAAGFNAQNATPMRGFADGGAIKVAGRQVLGAGTGKSDSIPAIIDGDKPAALSTGEYVFPIEAVQHFGLDKLNKMVEAARGASSK